jgi:hypothetical protein
MVLFGYLFFKEDLWRFEEYLKADRASNRSISLLIRSYRFEQQPQKATGQLIDVMNQTPHGTLYILVKYISGCCSVRH